MSGRQRLGSLLSEQLSSQTFVLSRAEEVERRRSRKRRRRAVESLAGGCQGQEQLRPGVGAPPSGCLRGCCSTPPYGDTVWQPPVSVWHTAKLLSAEQPGCFAAAGRRAFFFVPGFSSQLSRPLQPARPTNQPANQPVRTLPRKTTTCCTLAPLPVKRGLESQMEKQADEKAVSSWQQCRVSFL